MKKLLFILFIFICSCSGTKKLEKSTLSSNLKVDTEVSKKLDEKQTDSVNDQSVKTLDKKTDLSRGLVNPPLSKKLQQLKLNRIRKILRFRRH